MSATYGRVRHGGFTRLAPSAILSRDEITMLARATVHNGFFGVRTKGRVCLLDEDTCWKKGRFSRDDLEKFRSEGVWGFF